ncbi:hypothetical protein [Curtobacterium sp. 9128]|uniref:hypothetical protein n=1 Tax=Curtobacterium sp. 9128 TaxID=1793722 RepID=UPI0011A203EC|nr:hypothetical protein [Curtobacterium sp. 9128]
MGRASKSTPHVLALVGAGVVFLVGIGLLLSPWDGWVGAVGWVLIVVAVALAAITLFFSRAPRS